MGCSNRSFITLPTSRSIYTIVARWNLRNPSVASNNIGLICFSYIAVNVKDYNYVLHKPWWLIKPICRLVTLVLLETSRLVTTGYGLETGVCRLDTTDRQLQTGVLLLETTS